MFTQSELRLIEISLVDRLQHLKRVFEETKDLDTVNEIEMLNELIERITDMYEE